MRIGMTTLALAIVACGGGRIEASPEPADVATQDASVVEVPVSVDAPDVPDDVTEVTPDAGPPCVALLPGSWRLSGECVSMVLWFDADWRSCELELTSLTHPMGQPTSASVDGTAVTFHGGDWKGCQGKVVDEGRIDATCAVCAAGEAVGFTLLHAD